MPPRGFRVGTGTGSVIAPRRRRGGPTLLSRPWADVPEGLFADTADAGPLRIGKGFVRRWQSRAALQTTPTPDLIGQQHGRVAGAGLRSDTPAPRHTVFSFQTTAATLAWSAGRGSAGAGRARLGGGRTSGSLPRGDRGAGAPVRPHDPVSGRPDHRVQREAGRRRPARPRLGRSLGTGSDALSSGLQHLGRLFQRPPSWTRRGTVGRRGARGRPGGRWSVGIGPRPTVRRASGRVQPAAARPRRGAAGRAGGANGVGGSWWFTWRLGAALYSAPLRPAPVGGTGRRAAPREVAAPVPAAPARQPGAPGPGARTGPAGRRRRRGP